MMDNINSLSSEFEPELLELSRCAESGYNAAISISTLKKFYSILNKGDEVILKASITKKLYFYGKKRSLCHNTILLFFFKTDH